MPTTTNLLLPYPSATDTADVPRDIKALADKLDAFGALAGALPASPTDGQEFFYLADAANGVIWHFRYRAAAASPYKWEFVGGSPLHIGLVTVFTTTSGTPVADGTTTQIVIPFAGDYDIGSGFDGQLFGANLGGAAAAQTFYAGATIGTSVAVVASGNLGADGNYYASAYKQQRRGLTPAGQALELRYLQRAVGGTGATAHFANRELSVRPYRVG